jgi:hypothetical protein
MNWVHIIIFFPSTRFRSRYNNIVNDMNVEGCEKGIYGIENASDSKAMEQAPVDFRGLIRGAQV